MKYSFSSWMIAIGLSVWGLSWWISTVPPAVTIATPIDMGFRTVTRAGNIWSRGDYLPSAPGFTTVGYAGVALHGQGAKPQVSGRNEVIVNLTTGLWFIRSFDNNDTTIIQAPDMRATFRGEGTVFVDITKKTFFSLDVDVMLQDDTSLSPSFVTSKEGKIFLDLNQLITSLPPDMWDFYRTFVTLDQKKLLTSMSPQKVYQDLAILISREPTGSYFGIPTDTSIRRLLEDIVIMMKKIDTQQICGISTAQCYDDIRADIARGIQKDPALFATVDTLFGSWQRHRPDMTYLSWERIFHRYHEDILAQKTGALAIRDKSILTMIAAAKTEPTYDMWQYLASMLSRQEIGSVYSLQIMREMIRIGDLLRDTPQKDIITERASSSLANLRNILEKTYFTKQGYIFLLRKDLKNDEDTSVETASLVTDLKDLLATIDQSSLFATYPDFRLLRAQLVWFSCIFSRNDDYMRDPRTCRAPIATT